MAEQQQMGPDGWERGAPKPPVVDKVEPKTPSGQQILANTPTPPTVDHDPGPQTPGPMTPKVVGRPPKDRNRNRTSTGVRFERDLHARLVAAADERHVAVNFLVNRAVQEFLDRIIPVEEMQWTRPPEPGPKPPVYRPHSRACGVAIHPHGPACARDCPTCHSSKGEAAWRNVVGQHSPECPAHVHGHGPECHERCPSCVRALNGDVAQGGTVQGSDQPPHEGTPT